MRDLSVTRELENVDVSRDIRMDIGGGVFERIANTRLGTEMDDSVDPVVGKHFGERVGITEVDVDKGERSEEHTSELQSLMRISYAVFCLKKKNILLKQLKGNNTTKIIHTTTKSIT